MDDKKYVPVNQLGGDNPLQRTQILVLQDAAHVGGQKEVALQQI